MILFAQLIAGFIYLLGGGDLLVRGAVALARKLHVPPIVVALSIVALGTSLPELVVSIRASVTGYPGLVLGNVVGSNIANVLLVGGVAAVIFPLRTRDASVRSSGSVMVAASLLFAGLCLTGEVTRLEGGMLLVSLLVVLGYTGYATAKAYLEQEVTTPLDAVLGLPTRMPMIVLFVGAGLAALPLGAELLVEAAVGIAALLEVSETVVGLSVVAIGTSLPEVATAVVAALQRRTAMAVGTIVGSNTINILAIMGIAAAVSAEPISVSTRFLALDLPVMLSASILLVALAWVRRPVGRIMGGTFVAAYLLYLVVLLTAA